MWWHRMLIEIERTEISWGRLVKRTQGNVSNTTLFRRAIYLERLSCTFVTAAKAFASVSEFSHKTDRKLSYHNCNRPERVQCADCTQWLSLTVRSRWARNGWKLTRFCLHCSTHCEVSVWYGYEVRDASDTGRALGKICFDSRRRRSFWSGRDGLEASGSLSALQCLSTHTRRCRKSSEHLCFAGSQFHCNTNSLATETKR